MQTQTLRNFAGLPCISEERRAKLQELCSNLGITMQQYELLNLALTHTSFAHETHHYPHNEHNERLEFLGIPCWVSSSAPICMSIFRILMKAG